MIANFGKRISVNRCNAM